MKSGWIPVVVLLLLAAPPAEAQVCLFHAVRGYVFYPNSTPLDGAWVWVNNTSTGGNVSCTSDSNGLWECSIGDYAPGQCSDTPGGRLDVNANLSAPRGTWFNETWCPRGSASSTACWNMTLQIPPDIRLVREQSNTTGNATQMRVRLIAYNGPNATLSTTNLTVNESLPSTWTVVDNGTGRNNTVGETTYVNFTIGNLSADDFSILNYTVSAPPSGGSGSFRADLFWNYSYNLSVRGNRSGSLAESAYGVTVIGNRSLYEFALDLDTSVAGVNRSINNGTNSSARWNITNIGNSSQEAMPEPATARLLFNHTAWTIYNDTFECPVPNPCPAGVDNASNITLNATHAYLQLNITSLAPGATVQVNFTLNASAESLDEYARADAFYDPPAGFLPRFSGPQARKNEEEVPVFSPLRGWAAWLEELGEWLRGEMDRLLDHVILVARAPPPGTPKVISGNVTYHNGTDASGVFVRTRVNNSSAQCYLNTESASGDWTVDLADCPSGWWPGDILYINATLLFNTSVGNVTSETYITLNGAASQIAPNMTLNFGPNATLLSPPNNTTLDDTTPTFTWNTTDNDSDPPDTRNLTLYLDTDENLQNSWGDFRTYSPPNNSSTFTLPDSQALGNITRWYWRVRVNDSFPLSSTNSSRANNSTTFTFVLAKTFVSSGQDLFFRVRPAVCSSISVGTNFTEINWTASSTPQTLQPALFNNGSGRTWLNVSVSPLPSPGCTADLFVRANGSLGSGSDSIGLDNESYNNSTTDPEVSGLSRSNLTTSFAKVAWGLSGSAQVYFKFFLNVTASQPPGNYQNSVTFRTVRNGTLPQ